MTQEKPKSRKKPSSRRRPRLPHVGLLNVGERCTVDVNPPIREDERPAAITAHPGDVIVLDCTPEGVTIENRAGRIVPFVLLIVPKAALDLARMPWKPIAQMLTAGALTVSVRVRDLMRGLKERRNGDD